MLDQAVDEFRRSSFCMSGSCVEVARVAHGVALRDSKAPWKEEHVFTAAEWADFVRGVKAGEFDLGSTDDRDGDRREDGSDEERAERIPT